MSGKLVMITGAARGIGRACATAFAADGADLVLLDVAQDLPGVPYPLGSRSQLETTADLCRDHGVSVTTERVDIRDTAGVAAVVDRTLERHGRIDVLVNNAGLVSPSGKPVHQVTDDDWQLMIDVDLTGAFRMMRLVLPGMVRRGSGAVVNIASTAGLVGYRHFAGYVAAKHGLIGLTKAAALDYAPHGVRVNAVCPGSVKDDPDLEGVMLAEIARCLELTGTEHEKTFVATQPTNRLVRAQDVAASVRWLASDDATDVTGSIVAVDGGYTVR
ncbi:SDR family oxidoreductase [Umezawaea endophytica]|uniref:SDR family oxidoreductase n=1 Tax=Umezawaea endophytica TaxID=1654476 RepID=A0A9X3A6N1_9PSEU|nr:SDR family oxidoreductase [Umezawaea endophytica]MCS7483568.1 SDR family oxidoreductase [Umezawaea endophytica]